MFDFLFVAAAVELGFFSVLLGIFGATISGNFPNFDLTLEKRKGGTVEELSNTRRMDQTGGKMGLAAEAEPKR